MAAADIEEVARAKLGRMRLLMRGELRRTRKTLLPGERVLSMAVGTRGLKGRLIVATDQRFLLVRSKGCEDLAYERLTSVSVDQSISCSAAELVLATRDQAHSFQIAPPSRAVELAGLAASRLGAEKVSIKGRASGVSDRGARQSRRPVRLVLSILAWAAAGFLVFGWPFESDPDGDRRRAPVFAAGGCTDVDGTLVSCDDSGNSIWKLVARPAGTRRCSSDSRTYSHVVSRKVAQRLKARRLCLEPNIGDEE